MKICNGNPIDNCTKCEYFHYNKYAFPWANGMDFFCIFDPKNKIGLLINQSHWPIYVDIQPFCKLPDA